MMGERTTAILDASVRDFIRTGEPVTSSGLFSRYNFGIRPAMIRWELKNLADEGYFYQHHPSGGRIPSDKAYKFFINEVYSKERGDDEDEKQARSVGARGDFVEGLADMFAVLGMCYDAGSGVVYRSGIHDLLESMGRITRDDILEITEDVKQVPERIHKKKRWWQEETDWPQIFVGRSPFTRNDRLAVMVSKIYNDTENNEECLVIAVGAKRMDYEKMFCWFRDLRI